MKNEHYGTVISQKIRIRTWNVRDLLWKTSLVENVPLDKRAFGIRLQEHGMYDNKHG